MKLDTFLMERLQSTYENSVECNLTESGVQSLMVKELVDPMTIGDLHLGYGHTDGTPELKAAVATLYPGAGPENILITNGTAEANYLVAWAFGDGAAEAAMTVPNYLQMWGALESFGTTVRPVSHSVVGGRWALDLDQLASNVTNHTTLIAVCNPNNPTGGIFTETEMAAICRAADRSGAWIMADEVYRGAERTGPIGPTFWGRAERVIATAGLSKAYGLPGLRLGWVVAPPEMIAQLWKYKDYTTIGASPLSDHLARIALEPAARHRILARTRTIINEQYPTIESWLGERPEVFQWIAPMAGGFVYPQFSLPLTSTDLAERLRLKKSTLVVPGDHFNMGPYLRLGFGYDPTILREGLRRIGELIDDITSAR